MLLMTMPLVYYIGKTLTGVAVFLLGVRFMEEVLQRMAGRKFKLFLKKQTAYRARAVAGGMVAAAVLQSSSIVNLLVLSLAGVGILGSANALAIILGSNLGATVTNWVIGLAGFSYNTDVVIFPLAGLTGICMAFLPRSRNIYKWCKLLLGFSFLFVGIGLIKDSMSEAVKLLPLNYFTNISIPVFFVAGIAVTSLVQSTSATMALVLAALYANAIPLMPAMAIILGSEIGSSTKLFLISRKGDPVKNRIAVGNLLFNGVSALLILIFLQPVYHLIVETLQVSDHLLGLVLFQTLINVGSVILFYPQLGVLGRLLEKIFSRQEVKSRFISKVKTSDSTLSMEAVEKEAHRFLFIVIDFIKEAFDIEVTNEKGKDERYTRMPPTERYHQIKHLYGEIHEYYIALRKNQLPSHVSGKLQQLLGSVRNAMYAAKNAKDMWQNIEQLRNSSNDTKYQFYTDTRQKIILFCNQIHKVIQAEKQLAFQKVSDLYNTLQADYKNSLLQLYKESTAMAVSETEITTLLNFNRELYTALKSLVFSAIDYLLTPEEAENFDRIPGFIR